jgi:hypothetical protein
MATADCAAIVALMRSTASPGCDQIACHVIGQWLARRRRRDVGGLAVPGGSREPAGLIDRPGYSWLYMFP